MKRTLLSYFTVTSNVSAKTDSDTKKRQKINQDEVEVEETQAVPLERVGDENAVAPTAVTSTRSVEETSKTVELKSTAEMTTVEVKCLAGQNMSAVQLALERHRVEQVGETFPLLSLLIEPGWRKALEGQTKLPYFAKLQKFMDEEWKKSENSPSASKIYPPKPFVFRAFNTCPLSHVKVVLLGQDPYHGPGQAMGLSFSVPKGVQLPPSLQNIYKEISSDLGVPMPRVLNNSPPNGDLSKWAEQGVLLLNAVLTVRGGMAASHQKKGWEELTDAAIEAVSRTHKQGVVFIFWGNFAASKAKLVDKKRHHVLTAAHPSPLAAHRGFFGCRHFSKANELLIQAGREPIDWRIEA